MILGYNYPMRYTLIYLLFLLPALALSGRAIASPAEEPRESNIPILDTTQQLFGMQANTVANRLDLFFADQRADDELARSRFRIRQRYEVRDQALLNDDFQIRMNIRLPKLEDRFKFEYKDKGKDEEKAKKEKEKAKSGETTELARNELDRSWQFKSDIGVNASIPPKIAARARVRKNFSSGEVIHRFVEEIGWFSDRDWEENTTFDSDFTIDDDRLIRFRNYSDWKVTRKDFVTSHGPVFFQRLADDDAISTGTGLSTIVTGGSWYVTNYSVSATYRRNLYKQWIYMDATPGIDFPKVSSFRRTPFFAVQFEVLFGGI